MNEVSLHVHITSSLCEMLSTMSRICDLNILSRAEGASPDAVPLRDQKGARSQSRPHSIIPSATTSTKLCAAYTLALGAALAIASIIDAHLSAHEAGKDFEVMLLPRSVWRIASQQ